MGINWDSNFLKLSAYAGNKNRGEALINLIDSNLISLISPTYVNIPTISSVPKNVENGTVSGLIDPSGDLIGTYSGAEETAPKHTIVRYFIKAL